MKQGAMWQGGCVYCYAKRKCCIMLCKGNARLRKLYVRIVGAPARTPVLLLLRRIAMPRSTTGFSGECRSNGPLLSARGGARRRRPHATAFENRDRNTKTLLKKNMLLRGECRATGDCSLRRTRLQSVGSCPHSQRSGDRNSVVLSHLTEN